MANYGKYYIAVRLLLLKQYLEANAGRIRTPTPLLRRSQSDHKISFLDITIPHPFSKSCEKGCGLILSMYCVGC